MSLLPIFIWNFDEWFIACDIACQLNYWRVPRVIARKSPECRALGFVLAPFGVSDYDIAIAFVLAMRLFIKIPLQR